MTEREVCEWLEKTCLLFGARHSTALKVAAEFAAAFERGEIAVPTPSTPASPDAGPGRTE